MDDDVNRHRKRTRSTASIHLLNPNEDRVGRGKEHSQQPDTRPARNRLQMGRRSQHANSSRPLGRNRRPLHQRRQLQRSSIRPRLRSAQHGAARRRSSLLGHKVLLLQPAPLATRSRDQDPDRPPHPMSWSISSPAAPPTSPRRHRKPPCPGSTAASTTAPTSKSA